MPCPDRKTDAQILREIEKRKRIMESMKETPKRIEPKVAKIIEDEKSKRLKMVEDKKVVRKNN